jgi:hypothetical protein
MSFSVSFAMQRRTIEPRRRRDAHGHEERPLFAVFLRRSWLAGHIRGAVESAFDRERSLGVVPPPCRGRRWSLFSVTAVASALLSVAAATAQAASTVSIDGGVLQVAAAPGETNEVDVVEQRDSQSGKVTAYQVTDLAAGAIAGSGCHGGSEGAIVCSAAGVRRIVVHLGDGDDGATDDRQGDDDPTDDVSTAGAPLDVYGEAGNDRISHRASKAEPGVTDGGEGDDVLAGDDLRGGPGNDTLDGQRLLDGGDGNDVLHKSGAWSAVGGRLRGGPGDDTLKSDDQYSDVLECGDGRDAVEKFDASDSIGADCEDVTRPPPGPPRVTVFELPGLKARPGRDGRLAVWIKCSVPSCHVSVRIYSVGSPGGHGLFIRFRNPPTRRLIVGNTAKLFHLSLSKAQRRGLRRSSAGDGLAAIVVVARPGKDAKLQTDGLYCTRTDPCER